MDIVDDKMRFCEWENSHRPGLDRARWRWSLWMPARAGGILMHGGAAALLKAHVACGPAAATRRRAVHAAGPSLGRWQWRATVDGGRSRSLQGGPPCGPDGTSLERACPPRQQAGAKPLSSTQFPLPALHLARTGAALHPLCADITTDIRPGPPRRLVETAALRLVPWMQIFQRYCHLLLFVCGASPVVRFASGSGQLRRFPSAVHAAAIQHPYISHPDHTHSPAAWRRLYKKLRQQPVRPIMPVARPAPGTQPRDTGCRRWTLELPLTGYAQSPATSPCRNGCR